MRHNIALHVLTAVILLAFARPGLAAESKEAAPGQAKAVSSGKAPGTRNQKAAAPAKLVDINSASKRELMKLPGITDQIASAIITNRPYNTKARLVSKNIISMDAYEKLKNRMEAKQK